MKLKSTVKSISLNLVFLAFFCTKSNATIFTVNVANNTFSPANIPNVVVGDIIRWVWVAGFHTTTSTVIPAGAPAWDAQLISSGQTFDYEVPVAGDYNYFCSVHGVSMSGSFTASASLPVRLSEFKLLNENNNAVLKWTTELEDNIDYFSVQKSKTGSDFVEIAKVPAAGQSSVAKSYYYTDPVSPADKYYYYTIAIVDKEGKKQFSPVELFKNKLKIQKLIVSLSPNPVPRPGHLMLKFNADNESKMDVNIINMEGRSVMHTTLYATEGVNNGHLMLDHIAAGSYSVSFELNGIKEVHRLIIK